MKPKLDVDLSQARLTIFQPTCEHSPRLDRDERRKSFIAALRTSGSPLNVSQMQLPAGWQVPIVWHLQRAAPSVFRTIRADAHGIAGAQPGGDGNG
jgi:hypothetical protein